MRMVRLHQRIPSLRLLRRGRRILDDTIDLVRLKLDALPDGVYQPVPGLPVRKAKRAVGSRSRWAAMEPVVERLGVKSAMDVGANVGYFPIMLASRGVPSVALESVPKYVRTTTTAVRRNQLDNVAVMELELRADTLDLLPATDCTLVLSLWHHLVRNQGLDTATYLLRELWARTGKVMFFDSGEDEMPESFGLPRMLPTPDVWLREYLQENCAGARIEHLGRHRAFDAAGLPTDRALFAVIREPQ
ncbi:hypothetical protein SLUN_02440 [Streptomyces lunaelactis]|uniref:Methyltransferase type 11 domain-containing protein n=1 Tax=Streptomyces lunaelactis TaxID=1535768 RepID=A0A2R4SWL2_9ACTN|nr:hypothetical protein [Streptomyces lunaelactis]AVZ71259.1 hypothetical protein SLUN_02440 [Streptomyces lunaelactis]NUK86758.1 hypothetical protein [Streptomyces lunaelactis]